MRKAGSSPHEQSPCEVDELLDNLSSFSVSNQENCVGPRQELFKCKGDSGTDQRVRRLETLDRQKRDRQNNLAVLRKMEGSDCEEEEKEQNVRRINPYKNQLMLSEWLDSRPDDFEQDWLCKLAPVGHRTLIVARKGRTCSYTKSGYLTCTFPSLLPGGNSSSKPLHTVLDGVWSETHQTFYVLDILSYKAHPVVDSEAEFRFYWGCTKIQEDLPEISDTGRRNKYPMKWLPHANCDTKSLDTFLDRDHGFKVDGLLFYHKRGHYTPGSTPLVGWLKPDMLPKILDIPCPQNLQVEDSNMT